MTKLTLSIDEAVVAKAKRIAADNGTSVSAMFSQFVESVAAEPKGRGKVGPLTRKASGLAKLPEGKDDKELLADALADKYGVGE